MPQTAVVFGFPSGPGFADASQVHPPSTRVSDPAVTESAQRVFNERKRRCDNRRGIPARFALRHFAANALLRWRCGVTVTGVVGYFMLTITWFIPLALCAQSL